MTIEAIEEQIDDLRDAQDEIEGKKDPDVFCIGCAAIYTTYELVGYWGSLCRMPVETCPINFEPGAMGCYRGDEYEELEDAQEAILRDIGELKGLDVEVFVGGVA